MQPILTNLHHKIKAFCQPDPKSFPDSSTMQIVYDRNLMQFCSLIGLSIAFPIFAVFFKLPSFISFATFGFNGINFLSFLLFRRSYIWISHIIFSANAILLQIIMLEMFQETVYLEIGEVFLLLSTILIMTGSVWISSCSFLFEFIVLITQFKEKLVICIQKEEPEVFAENFVRQTLVFLLTAFLLNTFLVRALEKRTIELARAKMAIENALEQQKTFIFSFSHELRNPINSLLGNLQLVLQEGEALSDKAKEMISTAKTCGEILLHNINNVLDTGKHDIGKLEVNPTPTQLSELFQKTWGIYSELFRQKKLKSQLRIERNLPPVVRIDSHKINQILLNLIGNSIKFTEKGSVSVTIKWLKFPQITDKCFEPIPYDDTDEGLFEKEENVSTVNTSRFSESIPGFLGLNESGRICSNNSIPQNQPQSEAKGVLKIIVKDTGPGMKPEALEKLFKKFSQVSESASQRQIGSGLGLFITKEICHAMNGDVRAYSKLNKGTTFLACIPTISVPMTNIQKIDSESILKQLSVQHLKAIVADDSPFNINLISDYFAKFQASVITMAYNGYDAFSKYKECRLSNIDVDMVTLDIDMPIMDGRRTCDKIREYEREKKLKPTLIVLISGNYDKEQIEEYLDPNKGHKADCFLRKPVSFSEFHRAVYSLVVNSS